MTGDLEFLRPGTLAEALAAKAERPRAVPLAGGTDLMVQLNFAQRRPSALLDLTGLAELARISGPGPDGHYRIGATVPYTRLVAELGTTLPGLAAAARTVGSPQIRNRGTLAGNLGTASPAGDAIPPLVAQDALVEIASVRGVRTVPAALFCTGVKQTVLAEDELITAVLVRPAPGPQHFAKIGTRNAMVIAVCSLALGLDPVGRTVSVAIGSAAPTVRRAGPAERYAARALDWDGLRTPTGPLLTEFAELVAATASPIDDVRATADYRRHALAVLARRCLSWAWRDLREGSQ